MILLWGLLEDDPMGMAHAALRKAGADFVFLDHRKIFESQVDYAFSPGAGGRCTVTQGETTIDLGRVGAAYVRGADLRDYPEMRDRAPDDPIAAEAAAFEFQLAACLDASDAVVINRSEPSATNASKPFQLSVIREAGLGVPETFISNDAEAVRGFLARNPDSIYKSISGVRSIVRRVSAEHLDFLDDVGWCPSLFQRVVPGTNYRAHVLGGDVFAVRIESGQLDYRYGESTVVAAELPPEVAQKCVRLTSALGLHFSGIDLMRTPDDEWFCFEVNPSPAYSFFEQASGQPLSAALARFMIEADRRRGSP